MQKEYEERLAALTLTATDQELVEVYEYTRDDAQFLAVNDELHRRRVEGYC
jgi:hypothetical protein